MQTQITCPRCQTAFLGEVEQVIDVGLDPESKGRFLSGAFNVAQCPNCGAVTQVSTPILYHDPSHEQFMVHVPLELNLDREEQERLIGRLVQSAMDRLPAEQRKGYMLQPEIIISMQTLMEKVLETEGITREMIEQQQKQAVLLQELLAADGQAQTDLIRSRESEIDQTTFALLRASMEAAENNNESERMVQLTNLQAKLYRETSFGKKLDHQQQALYAFSREVNKAGSLSPKLLLKHVLTNRKDLEIVDALVISGQAAFNYEFFIQLSDRIEKRQKSGLNVDDLIDLRTHLLDVQDELQRQSQEALAKVQETLAAIMRSEDKKAAVKARLSEIDSLFLNVLGSMYAEANRRGDKSSIDDLGEIQDIIIEEMENQAPPQIRLINQLLRTESEEEQRRLLDDSESLINDELLQLAQSISADAKNSGETELADRAGKVEMIIRAKLQS